MPRATFRLTTRDRPAHRRTPPRPGRGWPTVRARPPTRGVPMDDAQVQARIEQLEDEERRLRTDEVGAAEHGDTGALGADRARLEEIRVELDRLWDLLRRRRALRDAGRDPDEAQARDAETVERYLG